ncbi:hypothetical protein FKW77_001744 [Venturia effusa]|uniref:WD repeat protein n=1 Tax=Venturia effusa TaxID=50376 RepID=A0A517KZ34_9PEZI|nr:hypothetical protein FKW77_001744 [Venturia effusa]
MSHLLSSECSQTPVTALVIHGGLIISGQGPFIRVHHQPTSRLLAAAQVLDGQAVHGIRICHSIPSAISAIIWGGRSLKAISISRQTSTDDSANFNVSLIPGKTVEVEDWILDVAPKLPSASRPSYETACATLLTAHNALYSVNWQEPSSHSVESMQLSVAPLLTGRKCILYSAHLNWTSATEILVASGTAFGEIIVWSCSLVGGEPSLHTHFSFTGHEGSIFGVQISEPIESPFKTLRRILTSCSDDRTIRVWDISNTEIQRTSSQSLESTAKQHKPFQETGFPVTLSDKRDSNCLAVAVGHVSRIWNIRYFYARKNWSNDHLVTIISVGEDGTCQNWAFRHEADLSSEERTYSLTHLSTSSHHLGKNIWSIAVNEQVEAPDRSVISTGGADGRIISQNSVHTSIYGKLLEERDITTVLQNVFNLPATKPINSEISRKASKATADYFRSYAYVTKNELLVTTNNGLVLLEIVEIDSNGESVRRWQQVDHLDDLKGYSVVSGIPDSGVTFLGGATGSLYCFDAFDKKIAFLTKTDGKIATIYPYPVEPSSKFIVDVLLTYLGTSTPRLIRLRRSLTGWSVCLDDDLTIQSVRQGAQFAQSSSALLSSIDNQLRVFLGYRDGSVHLLSRKEGGSAGASIVRYAHGKEAVTAMHWISSVSSKSQSTTQNLGWLFTVGRDGTCAVHTLRRDSNELNLVHRLTLPFGPNIEGIHVSPSADEVYVYGFHGKQFVVYNVSTSDYILNIDCGGAHRMWSFDPRYDPAGRIVGGNLAWTKASKLNSYDVLEPHHEIVQNGGHGREIKSCAITTTSTASLGPLIATGAEDTDICLIRLEDSKFSCVATIRKHVTGIQSLQWSENGEYLFSCGGYEEFFIWRVQPVPAIKVGVMFESSCPIDSEKSDLRIMSFAVKQRCRTERQREDAIQVIEFEITMKTVVVTTATDGHFAFWSESSNDNNDNSKELTCAATRALHQSAVKSLASYSLNTDTTLIVTGGDDNGLGVSLVFVAESNEVQCERLLIPRAHAAAVTATDIITCRPSEADPSCFQVLIATASNDQRIKIWGVDIDLRKKGVDGLDVKMLANGYTSIADVSSMALYPHAKEQSAAKILVCGVGMEIWTVDFCLQNGS